MKRTQADRDDDLRIGRELERKDAEIDRLKDTFQRIIRAESLGEAKLLAEVGLAPQPVEHAY